MLVFDLVPFCTHSGMFTDAARLRMLMSCSPETKRWLSLLALQLSQRSGKPLRLQNRRWLQLATAIPDGSKDHFQGSWLAYRAATDSREETSKAILLERCLELSGRNCASTFRETLILEASIFQAWFRRDCDKAKVWRGRVKNGTTFLPLVRLRADIALLWISGKLGEANLEWERGIALIGALPASANRELIRSSWSEWKQEMQDRALECQTAGIIQPDKQITTFIDL